MHVYNAIVVMKEILDVFPLASVNNSGPSINAAMDRFVETEERGDLKILARSLVNYGLTMTCLNSCTLLGTLPVSRERKQIGHQNYQPT